MPPGRHAALVRAWKAKERRKQARAAMVAVILANANRKKEAAPFDINDFMAGFADEQE